MVMKKKRKIFGKQITYVLWILLAVWAVSHFAEVIWAVKHHMLTLSQMMAALIGECVLVLAVGFGIWRFLMEPYNKTRHLFRQFIENGNYQELMENEYEIFPEQKEVLKKLDSMLDKKNIIQLSTKHAELLALQNQINPHFLYNTLEAIRGDALCEGVESIADTTEALSTFFRYTITGVV